MNVFLFSHLERVNSTTLRDLMGKNEHSTPMPKPNKCSRVDFSLFLT